MDAWKSIYIVDFMDAFESLVAMLLEKDGYWVRRNYKLMLTKEEKIAIERPSSPRWELDVIAYKVSTNEILVVECKSYLDSIGVNYDSLSGKGDNASYYKLFNQEKLREIALARLKRQLEEEGACLPNPKATLCLAAGKIKSEEHSQSLKAYFEEKSWRLFDPDWIRSKIEKIAADGYENDVASVVAKLILRK